MKSPLSSTHLLEFAKQACLGIAHLPFPVHVSCYRSGQLLFLNREAAELFCLSDLEEVSEEPALFQTSREVNIADYYENRQERERVLALIRDTSVGQWSQRVRVRLKINNQLKRIYFISKIFRDGAEEPQFLLCMALSVADSEWFTHFEEHAQEGLFEIEGDYVTDGNGAFVKILGYSSRDEVKKVPVKDLLWPTESFERLRSQIREERVINRRFVKLRRKDGTMLIARLSCEGHLRREGELVGVSGLISDVTFEAVQKDLPVGLFLISQDEHGKEIVAHANDAFAQILGYKKAHEVLNIPIRQFHVSDAAHQSFKDALNKADERRRPLLDHFMEVRDCLGARRQVVVNVRYVEGENRKIRVGAVYDLTGHINAQLRTLKNNFGAILHTYLATLNGLRSTLLSLLKSKGEALLLPNNRLDYEATSAEQRGVLKRLLARLDELEQVAVERGCEKTEPFERLKRSLNKLVALGFSQEREKDNAGFQRHLLLDMRRHLGEIAEFNMPREPVRHLRVEMEELLRIANAISLSATYDELSERILDFEFFRTYLRGEEPSRQDFQSISLTAVVIDVVRALEEFAALRQVDVYKDFNRHENIPVLGHKPSLNRALHNLLHNAIKYTWSKGEERRPWVRVQILKDFRQNQVTVVIENRGVPIRREELASGSIFEFGVRGKESDDRNRSGTGIGLFDAKTIIQQHNGSLQLTSEPIAGNAPDVYTNPFITRAFVNLPIHRDT